MFLFHNTIKAEVTSICRKLGATTRSQAVAAGASEDEIADVLLAVAPVIGLGRIAAAAPKMATALGYDIDAALEEPDDH